MFTRRWFVGVGVLLGTGAGLVGVRVGVLLGGGGFVAVRVGVFVGTKVGVGVFVAALPRLNVF